MENYTKGGGGSATGDFPLKIREKTNMGLTLDFCTVITFRHTYFGGGILFSLDAGPKAASNLKALWRSHLTSIRGPISYRIR